MAEQAIDPFGTTRVRLRPAALAEAWLAAIVTVAALFALQRHLGVDLADEGFLWYGAQRIALGEVPLRDFQSYDPGRYYWVAAWFGLIGDGLTELRFACAAFAVIGVAFGAMAVRMASPSRALMWLVVLLLVVWLYPRNKPFGPAFSLIMTFVAARLALNPSPRAFAVAGFTVGLAAFFGRNYGLYGVAAFALIGAILMARGEAALRGRGVARCALAFALGVVAGYAPMLVMIVAVPGFAEAFWRTVITMFDGSGAQISRAVPWPWQVKLAALAWINELRLLGLGVGFVVIPLSYALALVVAARRGRAVTPARALALAAAGVGLGYLHHAFDRSDIEHLAEATKPWLIAVPALVLALRGQVRRRAAAAVAALAVAVPTVLGVGLIQPLGRFVVVGEFRVEPPAEITITGDRFLVEMWQAAVLKEAEVQVRARVGPGQTALFAPYFAMLHARFRLRTPGWDNYYLFAHPPERQRALIRALATRRVALVAIAPDDKVDGKDRYSFANTHPLVWRHIREHYRRLPAGKLPRRVLFYGPKEPSTKPPTPGKPE